MDLKTKLKRNKLVRFVREYFNPKLKELREHYDSWVRSYKYKMNYFIIPEDGKYFVIIGNSGHTMNLLKGHMLPKNTVVLKA